VLIATRQDTSPLQCVQVLSFLALKRILTYSGGEAAPRRFLLDDSILAANQQVARALRQANARAWLAAEVLIAGEELWERAQVDWERPLEDSFFRPLRSFLDRVSREPFEQLTVPEKNTLRQNLDIAIRNGVLTAGSLNTAEILRAIAQDPPSSDWIDEEWELLGLLAKEVGWSVAAELQRLFQFEISDGSSLLVAIVGAFFRHAVLSDADLFGDLAPQLRERELSADERCFAEFAAAMEGHRARVDALLQCRPVAAPAPVRRTVEVNIESRLQRGREHSQRGDFETAIAEFTAALLQDPARVEAYAQRGDAHRLKGDNAQALNDFNAALRLDPAHHGALMSRGQVHWLARRFQEAIADFSALLQLDSHHALAYHLRGKTHLDAGDFQAAVGDFTEAQHLSPASPWPCLCRAR